MSRKAKISCVISAALLIIILGAFFCVRFMLHQNAEKAADWANNIRINGPWSGQAVWVSEEQDLYFVCETEAVSTPATVTAYCRSSNDKWLPYIVHWPSGTKKMVFCLKEIDDPLFDCTFDMNGTDQLLISNLSCPDSEFLLGKESPIALSKQHFDETIMDLPFSLE